MLEGEAQQGEELVVQDRLRSLSREGRPVRVHREHEADVAGVPACVVFTYLACWLILRSHSCTIRSCIDRCKNGIANLQ